MSNVRDIRAECRAGFTMVELLVVIMIIGILVTLVVSLAEGVRGEGYARRTQADMKILGAQIVAYSEASPNRDFPKSRHDTAAWNAATPAQRLNMAVENGVYLYEQLTRIEKTRNEVRERFAKDRFIEDPPNGYYLTDAFPLNRPFNYLRDGGPAGMPVFISAGENGVWNDTDDIRSDDHRNEN